MSLAGAAATGRSGVTVAEGCVSGQPPDEAALLERRNQPMHARLGLEVERFAHLVEAWGNAALFQAAIDEQQQFTLFRGEHGVTPPKERTGNV